MDLDDLNDTNAATFADFGLSRTTLDALAEKGITTPTPIQAAAIPLLLSGESDVLGQARTGTGKTAAFGIPIIECLEDGYGPRQPRAIILTPTRELCMQVATEIKSLCGTKHLFVASVYGGASIELQLRALKQGVDIVVGTPGRVQDMIDRGALNLEDIMFAVLDEADEMLDMGFVDDIDAILCRVPEDRRMLMFSATMPEEILAIAEKFMPDCEVIRVDAEVASLDQIDRFCYELRREEKVEALIRIMDMDPEMYGLVFCRTRLDVDELCEQLSKRKHRVEALHGDISQAQRTKVIRQFKDGIFKILVATDVAARGIDVAGLTHVVNYSLPQNAEIYIHRIGRTGRAGKNGTAITFVTPGEKRKLAALEQELGSKLEFRQLPTPEELVTARRNNLIKKVTEEEADPEYLEFAAELLDSRPPAELVAALLRISFGKQFRPSAYARIGKPPRPAGKEVREHKERAEYTKLLVMKGKDDGITPPVLLEMIYNAVRITSKRLGKISCFPKNCIVEVPPSLASKIVSGVNGHTHSTLMRIEGEAPGKKAPREKFEGDKKSSFRKEKSFKSDKPFHKEKSFRKEKSKGGKRR